MGNRGQNKARGNGNRSRLMSGKEQGQGKKGKVRKGKGGK